MRIHRLFLSILALFWAATAAAKPFVFTAIPDDNEARLRERFDKVAAYLTKQLGTEVKFVPVKTYAASVTAFKNDQVQMAWFGGLSGLQARLAVPGSQAIVQGEEDKQFVTYFIANAKTGLKEGAELPKSIAGKTFTFGAKDSTSGRLMPEFYIRQVFGKSPEEVFARVGFSGDHSKTIALVQSGAYDVGAVNYTVWNLDLQGGQGRPVQGDDHLEDADLPGLPVHRARGRRQGVRRRLHRQADQGAPRSERSGPPRVVPAEELRPGEERRLRGAPRRGEIDRPPRLDP